MLMLPVTYKSQHVEKDSDLYYVPYSVLTIWEDNGLISWGLCLHSHFQQVNFIGISEVGTKAVSVLGSGLSSGQVVRHICKSCHVCVILLFFPCMILLFCWCLGPDTP